MLQVPCRDCGSYHGPGELVSECEGPRGYRWDQIDKDQYGMWLCPMCPDPGPETPDWAKGHGQRGLHLVWETSMSVADDALDIYDAHEFETAQWKVECISGHVLLTSRDFGSGDEEEPPLPFRNDMLLKQDPVDIVHPNDGHAWTRWIFTSRDPKTGDDQYFRVCRWSDCQSVETKTMTPGEYAI